MHEAILPFGPQHPGLEEAVYFKLKIDGEEVVDLEINLGYEHKGVEKSFEGRSWHKNLFLASRICGICNHQHTSAYAQGVEKLLDIRPNKRVQYIRTIMTELERIQSHILWAGIAAHEIGFDTLFMYCWKAREYILDCVELVAGKRVHYDINTFGGVRRDITPELKKKLFEKLDDFAAAIAPAKKTFFQDSTVRARVKGVGVLKKDIAEEMSAVGPMARASGIDFDIRKVEPYQAFNDFKFKVITSKGCDVLARVVVRIKEVEESVKIIKQALEALPGGDLKGKSPFLSVPEGEVISRVEAPRGELFYYIKSIGGQIPYRVKVRTPSYSNFAVVYPTVVGGQIADAPIAIMSMDPCVCCTDRMEVFDINKNKSKIMTSHEITALGGHEHPS